MKKVLSVLLAVCLFVSALPMGAEANIIEYQIPGGTLTFDRDTGTITRGSRSLTGALGIPAQIGGVAVTKIGSAAFEGCKGVTSVEIFGNVSTIDFFAFRKCSGLTSLKIHANDIEIWNDAFRDCTSLESIEFPDNVAAIHPDAFNNCTSLTSIKFLGSVGTINSNAFKNCTGLTSIELPRITELYGGFEGCTGLTSVTIPDSVTLIGGNAFENCTGLTSIDIPGNVLLVTGDAFRGCKGLTSVTIHDGTTAIREHAFFGCTNLTSVTIPPSVIHIDPTALAIKAGGIHELEVSFFYKLKIYGVWASEAWSFANYHDIPFVDINKLPSKSETIENPDGSTTTTETYKDGKVTATTTKENGGKIVSEEWPAGDRTIEVISPDGETMAKIFLLSEPYREKSFEDVKHSAWYKDAVDTVTGHGLFNGTSDTEFSPNDGMTRGMLATVLHNLSDTPEYGTDEKVFTDVPANSWYEDPVDWAYKMGVVSGTSKTEFSPNQDITREQLVTMLYRYAGLIGAGSKNRAQLTNFPDGGKVEGFAKDAMQWAVAESLLSGRAQGDKSYIAPQDTATRAEVAAVLARFIEYLKNV